MNHGELVRRITAAAESRGLLWHVCGRSQRCSGQPGLPDLVVVGRGGVAFFEAKTGGQLEPGQLAWRDVLQASGTRCLRVDPVDLWNGVIDGELDRLAGR